MLELAFPGGNSKGKSVVSLVPGSGDPVAWVAGAFILLALCQGFSEMVQRVSFARFAIGLVHDARGAAITRLADRRDEIARTGDPGDLIARVIGDSSRVKSGIKGVLIKLTQSGTFFLGVSVMLFVIDPPLGVVFLVGGALVLSVAYWGASRATQIARRARKREGRLMNAMQQLLTDPQATTPDEALPGVGTPGEKSEAKLAQLEGLVIWGVHGLLAITSCLILVLGIHRVRSGHLQPGDLTVVVFYLLMVHNPTVRAGRQAIRVGRLLASAERLAKVLDPASARAAHVPDAPPEEWALAATPRSVGP
jgi:ATP-binding cassette subfamily B protein